MTHPDTPLRRLVVAVDVQRYSERSTLDQDDAQAALVDALSEAATRAGLDRDAWKRQPQGDGELAVLPADIDEPVVVADFVRELRIRLARRNRSLKRELRLRLRVAVHSGTLLIGANGYSGPAPVETCRLRDAGPLKAALAAVDDADLALIVSKGLYRDIVEPGYRDLRPEDFHRVRVSVKEFSDDAYVCLPGYPVSSWLPAVNSGQSSGPENPESRASGTPGPPDAAGRSGAGDRSGPSRPRAAKGPRRSAERPRRSAQTYDFGGARIGALATGEGDAVAGDKVVGDKISNTFHRVGRDVNVGRSRERGDDER